MLAIASAVTAALVIFSPTTTEKPTDQAGSSVPVNQAPTLKTCELVSKANIQSSLGDRATSLTDGTRQGIIATTGKIAESCEYNFETAKTKQNSLSLQTYIYDTAEGQSSTSNEVVGAEWSQLIDAKQTSYFQQYNTADGETTISALRVIVGAHNYLFIARQPAQSITFTEPEIQDMLLSMSATANFSLADEANPGAPPAPDVPITELKN